MSNNKIRVLVIGRHENMLHHVIQMLETNDYIAFGETENENAIASFQKNSIDAAIIGGGVDAASRNMFHSEFIKMNSNVVVIDAHPQTVLLQLKQALNNRK